MVSMPRQGAHQHQNFHRLAHPPNDPSRCTQPFSFASVSSYRLLPRTAASASEIDVSRASDPIHPSIRPDRVQTIIAFRLSLYTVVLGIETVAASAPLPQGIPCRLHSLRDPSRRKSAKPTARTWPSFRIVSHRSLTASNVYSPDHFALSLLSA